MAHVVRYVKGQLVECPLCIVRYTGRQVGKLGCNTRDVVAKVFSIIGGIPVLSEHQDALKFSKTPTTLGMTADKLLDV
ncbi:hypothetical protein DSO57_1019448 [Entomophthora muscae]|uniref:Uncharacterized protein n=1 Tax=Entomophthora muscae TaxID=34485 RepID=A0ACC2RV56_9FUNG|nr:hypothetical protein DSO57_1019448 [Entomophthora muscae]